jgi:hypothetical protein
VNTNVIVRAFSIALCVVASGISASAVAAGAGMESDVAPPAPREERAPAPRDGYIWAPGYWDWNGHAYSWVSGRYLYEHRGAHWVPDRWEQAGSHWQHVSGHWEH